jgi:hypothetical protein
VFSLFVYDFKIVSRISEEHNSGISPKKRGQKTGGRRGKYPPDPHFKKIF